MESRSLIHRLAWMLVAFSILAVVLQVVLLDGRGAAGSLISLVINSVLAYFLVAGHGWARWVLVLRCGAGAVFSVATWADLGNRHMPVFSAPRMWVLFSAVFCVVVTALLVLSKRVNRHFNPTSGF